MIVDAHLHVWRSAPDHPNPGATIVSPTSDVPVELLRQSMDEHGVDRAVLVQPLYPGEDNSYVADCAANDPDLFAAVCYVDPRREGADRRLRYWVRERGCRGLRIRPSVPGEEVTFGRPASYPVWEAGPGSGKRRQSACIFRIGEVSEHFKPRFHTQRQDNSLIIKG